MATKKPNPFAAKPGAPAPKKGAKPAPMAAEKGAKPPFMKKSK